MNIIKNLLKTKQDKKNFMNFLLKELDSKEKMFIIKKLHKKQINQINNFVNKRRQGKTFTMLLLAIKYSLLKEQNIYFYSYNIQSNKYIKQKLSDLLKEMNIKYIENNKHLIIKLNNTKISFLTQNTDLRGLFENQKNQLFFIDNAELLNKENLNKFYKHLNERAINYQTFEFL